MSKLKPMKCSDVINPEDLTFPLISSEKVDGVYAVNVGGRLLGRSLKTPKSEFIVEALSKPKFEGFVGELCYTPDGPFKGLNREDLCRSTTSKVNTIKGEWKYSWVLFDYIHPDVVEETYEARMRLLRAYLEVDEISLSYPIGVAPSWYVTSPQEVVEAYQRSLDKGMEGLILRKPDGEWKNGRSTLKQGLFLRMKPQSDKEAVVTGVEEAMFNGNEATTNELGYTERSSHRANKTGKGMIGAFTAIDVESGAEITVSAGKLTHEDRVECFNNPPIGKIIKYRSMDTGVKDKPRFPRFYSWRNIEDMSDDLVAKVENIIGGIK